MLILFGSTSSSSGSFSESYKSCASGSASLEFGCSTSFTQPYELLRLWGVTSFRRVGEMFGYSFARREATGVVGRLVGDLTAEVLTVDIMCRSQGKAIMRLKLSAGSIGSAD